MSDTPIRMLSFGAGVQSSAVAMLSLTGEIPPFDHVIFADTGDEPESVYVNLKWWAAEFDAAGVSFHVVGRPVSISSELRSAVNGDTTSIRNPPLHIRNADGTKGMVRRKCTADFKVAPIERKVKEILGIAGKRHNHITETLATQTMGISLDESQRMRDAAFSWLRHDYPLVDLRLTRSDCIRLIAESDHYPDPPRSACWHCPFHSDAEWRHLRNNEPDAFRQAIELDDALRSGKMLKTVGLNGVPFLHASCRPLSEVDFDNEEDRGQQTLWGNECEGMCGL